MKFTVEFQLHTISQYINHNQRICYLTLLCMLPWGWWGWGRTEATEGLLHPQELGMAGGGGILSFDGVEMAPPIGHLKPGLSCRYFKYPRYFTSYIIETHFHYSTRPRVLYLHRIFSRFRDVKIQVCRFMCHPSSPLKSPQPLNQQVSNAPL